MNFGCAAGYSTYITHVIHSTKKEPHLGSISARSARFAGLAETPRLAPAPEHGRARAQADRGGCEMDPRPHLATRWDTVEVRAGEALLARVPRPPAGALELRGSSPNRSLRGLGPRRLADTQNLPSSLSEPGKKTVRPPSSYCTATRPESLTDPWGPVSVTSARPTALPLARSAMRTRISRSVAVKTGSIRVSSRAFVRFRRLAAEALASTAAGCVGWPVPPARPSAAVPTSTCYAPCSAPPFQFTRLGPITSGRSCRLAEQAARLAAEDAEPGVGPANDQRAATESAPRLWLCRTFCPRAHGLHISATATIALPSPTDGKWLKIEFRG